MSLKPLSGFFALVLVLGAMVPADAQGYDMRRRDRTPTITVPQGSIPDIGRPYALRVTTGSRKQMGWEQDLIQGNPNLKHWTWIPVSTAEQAYLRVAPGDVAGKGKPQPRPKSCYVKPTHVPLPMVTRYAPKEVAPPVRPAVSNRPTVASSNVSGRVRVPRVVSEQAAPAQTLSYGGSYGDVSGRLRTPSSARSSSESRDVYGKLVTRGLSH